jgi:hypothetical protein
MVVVGLVSGFLGWTLYRARVQRDAVWAIERAGGRVLYDCEWRWGKGTMPPTGAIWSPHPWFESIGIDYVSNVVFVDLGDRGSDELLEHVGRLPKLKYLRLARSPVTDAGLAHLDGLNSLRWLSLDDTKVTDSGLVHLSRLTRLETLLLGLTGISDSGLPHLKSLTGLKVLSLSLTSVTIAGGRNLQKALPTTGIIGSAWPGKNEERALQLSEMATEHARASK